MNASERLATIAERFGTPSYVYDVSMVRRAARWLLADLPKGADLFYSVKANPHPAVIRVLCELGLGAEVSSPGELFAALRAGCAPEDVIYTGPGKSPDALAAAIAGGVRMFSVESATDRTRLVEAARAARCTCRYLVRLNGPSGSSAGSLRMTGRPSAFGIDVSDESVLAEVLRPTPWAVPAGVHTYFATNVADEDALLAEFDQAVRTTARLCERFEFSPEVINLGGGFPAPFGRAGELNRHPRLAEGVRRAVAEHLGPLRTYNARIIFESGRYLSATAGTLVSRVLDVKAVGDRSFTVIDAGVNVLGGMSGLGRLISPRVEPMILARSPGLREPLLGSAAETTTLVGPLCTPLDVLNPSAALVSPAPGDLVAIPNVGAYGLTASLVGFLSHAMPVEVVHDRGELLAVRRLQIAAEEVFRRPDGIPTAT